MSNPNPSPETQFKPSNKLGGRPKGSRDRLTSAFIDALAEDFEANGTTAIERCREGDPAAYLRLVASLVPKTVNVDREVTLLDYFAALAAEESDEADTADLEEEVEPVCH